MARISESNELLALKAADTGAAAPDAPLPVPFVVDEAGPAGTGAYTVPWPPCVGAAAAAAPFAPAWPCAGDLFRFFHVKKRSRLGDSQKVS